MLGLRGAHDVEDLISTKPSYPVTYRSQVRRGIAEPLVGLLNNEREGLAVPIDKALRKDTERPIAFDEEALGSKILDDVVQEWVVRALSGDVVVGEENAEFSVDVVEVADALGNEYPPGSRSGVSSSPACSATTRARARSRNSPSASNDARAAW